MEIFRIWLNRLTSIIFPRHAISKTCDLFFNLNDGLVWLLVAVKISFDAQISLRFLTAPNTKRNSMQVLLSDSFNDFLKFSLQCNLLKLSVVDVDAQDVTLLAYLDTSVLLSLLSHDYHE